MDMNSAGPSETREDTDERKETTERHRKRKRRKGDRKKKSHKTHSDVDSEVDSSKELTKYHSLPHKRKNRGRVSLSTLLKKSDVKQQEGDASRWRSSEGDSDVAGESPGEYVLYGKQYLSFDPYLHPRDRLKRMTVKDALLEKRMRRVSGDISSSNLERIVLDELNSHTLTGSLPDLTQRSTDNGSATNSPIFTLVPEHKNRSKSTDTKLRRGRRVSNRPDIEKYRTPRLDSQLSDPENQEAKQYCSRRKHSISPYAILSNNQAQLLSNVTRSESHIATAGDINKSSVISPGDGNNQNQHGAQFSAALDDLAGLSTPEGYIPKLALLPSDWRQSFEDSERERRESFGKFMDLRQKLPAFSQSSLARVKNEELGDFSGLSSTDEDGSESRHTCDSEWTDYAKPDIQETEIIEKIKNLSKPYQKDELDKHGIRNNEIERIPKSPSCSIETLVGSGNGGTVTSLPSSPVPPNVSPVLNPRGAHYTETMTPHDDQTLPQNAMPKCKKTRNECRDTPKTNPSQDMSPTTTIPVDVTPAPSNGNKKQYKEKISVKESTGDSIDRLSDKKMNEVKHKIIDVCTIAVPEVTGGGTSTSDTYSKGYNRSISDSGEIADRFKSPRLFVRNRSASNVPSDTPSGSLLPGKKYRSLSPEQMTQCVPTNKDDRVNTETKPKKSKLKYRRSFSPKQKKNKYKTAADTTAKSETTTCDTEVQTPKFEKISVAVQTCPESENTIYLFSTEDRDLSNMEDSKSDVSTKHHRHSTKKKKRKKEKRKYSKKRNEKIKNRSSESVDSQVYESCGNNADSTATAERKTSSSWGKFQPDSHTNLSMSLKPKGRHPFRRDKTITKSSSAIDISAACSGQDDRLRDAHSHEDTTSVNDSSILKKSRSAAEIGQKSTIDDVLSFRPFVGVSATGVDKSPSDDAVADDNERKTSTPTSAKSDPKNADEDDKDTQKDSAEPAAEPKPQGKISLLAIVALKRKLARRRKTKVEGQGLEQTKKDQEAKDQEASPADLEKTDYQTFVSIENETNLNLSELAFLKETAILDDDYYDSNEYHHPTKKHISFDPIVSDEPLEDEHMFGRHGERYRERRDSRIREKQKKVLNCCKKFLAFLFSHIGLCTLVVAYSIMGGIIFKELEQPFEKKIKLNISDERKTISHDIGRLALSVTLNKRGMDEFVKEVDRLMTNFQRRVWSATEENGWNGKDYTSEAELQWSFASSLLFAITIMTTIGYGHVAPKTAYGRIVTIAYAILGIPLTLLCLTNIGDLMATGFRFLYGRVCCGWCCTLIHGKRRLPDPERGLDHEGEVVIHQNDKHAEVIRVPTSVCILLMTSYIFLGTVLFSVWEEWDMLKGTYFSFITLSTIGLGDVVPGTTMWESEMKLVFCAMYLIFGLSLIAMCFNLVQEDVKAKCRWLGTKLGIIDSATSDV